MRISLCLLIVVLSFSCKAQFLPHPPCSYTKNDELNKFVGVWVDVSGNTRFEIVLEKQKVHYPAPLNYYLDNLIGRHQLTVNGSVVEGNLQHVGESMSNLNFSLFGTSRGTHTAYFTTVRDLTKDKSGRATLTLLPGSTTQAQWTLSNTPGLKLGEFDFNFTLPLSAVMVKQ